MPTRRQFVLVLPAAAVAVSMRPGFAQAGKVEESDPQAVALGYKHDAAKVDAKKYPSYATGRVCSNCQLYSGKAGDEWGACSALGNRLVNAKGWCVAWVKKAG